jgi:hypothetical protein
VSQLRPLDVPHARLRRGVLFYAPNRLLCAYELLFRVPVVAKSVRFSAVHALIGTLLQSASVPKQLSCSIDRFRRKRQRLPSSLLIENVRRSTSQLRLSIRPPRHFR